MVINNIQIIQHSIALILIIGCVYAAQETLWDLGVVINKDKAQIYQREININYISTSNQPVIPQNIKALHSNSFIEPILHEIKNPINSNNIIKAYDDIINMLSIGEKTNLIKKAFLNKEYLKFFTLHKPLEHKADFNSMYIQNLYYSKTPQKALESINKIKNDELSDEILLFKIKTLIQLKNILEAQETINLFLNTYPNSDLINYVNYENKMIQYNNEN